MIYMYMAHTSERSDAKRYSEQDPLYAPRHQCNTTITVDADYMLQVSPSVSERRQAIDCLCKLTLSVWLTQQQDLENGFSKLGIGTHTHIFIISVRWLGPITL